MPVSIYQQVIAGLTPAMDVLRDVLCKQITVSGLASRIIEVKGENTCDEK